MPKPAPVAKEGTKVSVRKRPQQDRSRETVDVILTTAAKLIAREGYGKVSTNRIAQTAGVSIGSLYQYFPSKEAIILELFEQEVTAGLEALDARLEAAANAPLEAFLQAYVGEERQPFNGNLDLAKIVLEQVPAMGKAARVCDVRRSITELLLKHLSKRKSELRDDISAETLAFLISQAQFGVATGLILAKHEGMERDPRSLLMEILAPFLKKAA